MPINFQSRPTRNSSNFEDKHPHGPSRRSFIHLVGIQGPHFDHVPAGMCAVKSAYLFNRRVAVSMSRYAELDSGKPDGRFELKSIVNGLKSGQYRCRNCEKTTGKPWNNDDKFPFCAFAILHRCRKVVNFGYITRKYKFLSGIFMTA